MAQSHSSGEIPGTRGAGYKTFVVIVIMLANILNYADRMILSVLAEPIKHDLAVSDARMGFLFGTSFVLFHGLTGIAAATVADAWLRHRLLAIGIACWTGMTALSGFAQNYTQLAVARFGVGLGESAISPVGHSLLADLFSARMRGRVFSLYLIGPFVGSALCIAVAGWLLGAWPQICEPAGLCGIKPWQACFLVFGLPGLAIALLVLMIGEPAHDVMRRRTARPLAIGLREISRLIPPFSLLGLAKTGGRRQVLHNLLAAALVAGAALLLIRITGDVAQWSAVGIALYASISWIQGLRVREPALYARTAGSIAFRCVTIGMSLLGLIGAAMSFWSVPLALRTFGLAPHEASGLLGAAVGGGALIGTLVGGASGDWLRRRREDAAAWIGIVSLCGSGLSLVFLLQAPTIGVYAAGLVFATAFASLWTAPVASLVQDLILPTMRGRGAVMFSLTLMLVSLSLGPYIVGKVADASGSLGLGLASLYLVTPAAIALLVIASRAIPGALAEARLLTEQEGETA